MSFHSYTIDGYGIEITSYTDKINAKSFVETLRSAPVTLARVKDYLLTLEPESNSDVSRGVDEILDELTTFSNDELVKRLEDYEADDYFVSGISAVIAEAMSEDENIPFTLCDDFYGNAYILIEPSYPWTDISAKEKALTKEYLDTLFTNWVSALCGTEISVKVDYQSVENGG